MWIDKSLLKLWLMFQIMWTCHGETPMHTRPSVLDGGCNPYVDMIFVLDKSTNITENDFEMQRNFISLLLKDHKAPKGAVRVAVMICGDNETMMSQFTEDISVTSDLYLPLSSTSYKTNSNRHCLDNLNLQFKTKSRDGVARQAVLVRGTWNWNLEEAKVYINAAKAENTVIVVIAVGLKQFDDLSASQILATGDSTYFVLPTFQNLNDLASVLAKDTCKPISLDLTSETRERSLFTTAPIPIHQEPCKQLTDSMFKRHIPGFGYTRLECLASEKLDLKTCTCV